MSMVAVQYLGGSAEVYIPAAGLLAHRGVNGQPGDPLEVSEQVAGREPGDWHRPERNEAGGVVEQVPEHWHRAVDAAGEAIVQDPGSGLLAQPDVWARAKRRARGGSAGDGHGGADA